LHSLDGNGFFPLGIHLCFQTLLKEKKAFWHCLHS
jgi:hypothetical protein